MSTTYINFEENNLNDSYSDNSDNSVSNFEYNLEEHSTYVNHNKIDDFDYKKISDEEQIHVGYETKSENEQEENQQEEIKPKIRKYIKKPNVSNTDTDINNIPKTRTRNRTRTLTRTKRISKTQEEKNLRNRESARLCRLRKKEYILGLEKQITELTNQNKKLKSLLANKSNI
jgi:hypothetical protein